MSIDVNKTWPYMFDECAEALRSHDVFNFGIYFLQQNGHLPAYFLSKISTYMKKRVKNGNFDSKTECGTHYQKNCRPNPIQPSSIIPGRMDKFK